MRGVEGENMENKLLSELEKEEFANMNKEERDNAKAWVLRRSKKLIEQMQVALDEENNSKFYELLGAFYFRVEELNELTK